MYFTAGVECPDCKGIHSVFIDEPDDTKAPVVAGHETYGYTCPKTGHHVEARITKTSPVPEPPKNPIPALKVSHASSQQRKP